MTRPFSLVSLFAAGAFALAGCDVPTGGGGAQQQFESFVKDAATAEIVADECPSLSLRNSPEALVESFVNQMIAAGYTPVDLLRAQQQTNLDSLAFRAAVELTNAGVVAGNSASFCAYGRSQIASGTRVGSFLR